MANSATRITRHQYNELLNIHIASTYLKLDKKQLIGRIRPTWIFDKRIYDKI